MSSKPRLEVFPDTRSIHPALAQHLLDQAKACRDQGRDWHVSLAGGSTPRGLYQALADENFRDQADWQHMHFWFGDERFVAPDHADSNQRMAREALLDQVPLPADNIHVMPTVDVDPETAAARYEQLLRDHLPEGVDGFPCFDCMLLGLGDDGHTASLFPGTSALQETRRAVVPVINPHNQSQRLSISFPVINAAREVILLVAGAAKQAMVARAMQGGEPALPIDQVQPQGDFVWYLDEAAAALIDHDTP